MAPLTKSRITSVKASKPVIHVHGRAVGFMVEASATH
jgi:hypothetical protein